MYEPMERLALHVNGWQVNANIFKVMRNAFLRDFYFSLWSTVQQRTKKPDKNYEAMNNALLQLY